MDNKSPLPKVLLQLELSGTDIVVDVHRVVAIKADIPTVLSIEKMKDGQHRLTYNALMIPDLTKVQGLKFIRQQEHKDERI